MLFVKLNPKKSCVLRDGLLEGGKETKNCVIRSNSNTAQPEQQPSVHDSTLFVELRVTE